MADLIEIGVEVRTNSVRSATKEVDSLGKTLKSAERSASAFVNAFASQERQVSKAATANRAYSSTAQAMYNEILKINTATKSASGSASVFAADLEKQAQALHRLKMSTDASYASTNKLQAAKKILKREVRENGMAVEQYVEAMRKVVQANNASSASAQLLGKRTSRFGVLAQQTGYQVGDFAVQVQSGQNVMVAFGQQATQLVGTLSMLAKTTKMITVFAGLGIAIPILTGIAAAFFRTREAADESSVAVKAFEESLKAAKQETVEMAQKLEFLKSGFKTEGEYALDKDLAKATAEAERLKTGLENVKNARFESKANELTAVSTAKDALSVAEEQKDLAEAALQTYRDTLTELEEEEFQRQKNLRLQREQNQAAEDHKTLVAETTESQKQRRALEAQILTSGKDSWAVAKLRAEQGAENLGYTKAEAASYVAMEKAIRAIALKIKMKTEAQKAFDASVKAAATSYDRLVNQSSSLDVEIAKVDAQIKAVKNNTDVATAAYIAGERAKVTATYETTKALAIQNNNLILLAQNAIAYSEAMDKLSNLENLKLEFAKLSDVGGGGAAKAAKDLADEALRLNEANDPLLKFNNGIDKLNKLMKTGKLAQRAYNGEVAKLQDGLADSIPLVGDISDAFGDFVARGLKDFKGFVQQILGSFTSMISQMIATAARNKIMLSMGIGGTGIAGKAAGLGGSLLGSAGGGLAGLAGSGGIMGGVGSIASGIGGIFSGGGLGASFANLGGLMSGSVGGLGAIGAAIPAIGLVVAGLGLFIKKTKVLDTGLRATVDGFDVAIETFERTQTSRLFGLLKGKKKTGYAGASAEVADPLVKAVGEIQQSVLDAADTLGIGADAFDNFSYQFKVSLKGLSEEEQFQKVTQELNKMGDSFASLSGHFETMNELLAAANKRMELRNRMDKLLNNNAAILTRQREAELSAMHALNRPLAQAVYQLEDAQSVVTNAFAALRASIDSVVSDLKDKLGLANEAINKSKSIYETLSEALRSRRVSGDEAFSGRRESAVSFLRRGVFGDERKLQNALGVVAEPSEQLFGSFVDYARDFGLTGNVIAKAAETAKVQLSADEQAVELLETQIETFDAQLQMMVNQYNALLGIDTSVKSVADAMSALRSALGSFASAQGAAQATASARVPQPKETEAALQEVTIVRTFKGGNDAFRNGASGVELSNGQVFKTESGWGDNKEIQNATKKAREAVIAAGGIPKFAAGGMHSGGLRMVGERGPELEATGPSRIFSHNQTSGLFKDPDLKEAVNELRREISGLRDEQRQMGAASAKYAKRNYDINRKWDTDGLPSTRT
jgi:hypothetical protein